MWALCAVRFSSTRRTFGLILGLLSLGGTGWLATYVYHSGFTKKWRGIIAKELAKHGLRAEIKRLTLDPVDGLTAREVRLFDTTHEDQRLATIDRISLEVDVARLMNGEDFLRTVQLDQADVTMPVDPADRDSEWLVVRNLNARLVFESDRIEIARADGIIAGILMRARGSVKRPVPKKKLSREDKEKQMAERERQLRLMRDRRGAVRSALRILEKFQPPESALKGGVPHKAMLSLELAGDLANWEELEVKASLRAGPLKAGTCQLTGIEAEAELSGGGVDVKSLTVRDAAGALRARASWMPGKEKPVKFAADCDMDAHALLREVLEEAPWLGEVVFYSPPSLRMEGEWTAGQPWSLSAPPILVTGRLETRRFLTQGTVFEAMAADFSLDHAGRIYVRNALLSHHSGSARGQYMSGPGGKRYVLDWNMIPQAVLPLVRNETARRLLEQFVFSRSTRISVKLAGSQAADPGAKWKNSGRAELRDFEYRGEPVTEVAAEVSYDPSVSPEIRLRDVRLGRPEGAGTAKEVRINPAGKLLHISGGQSRMSPAPVVAMFHPGIAREIGKYWFQDPPAVALEGVIDLDRGAKRNNIVFAVLTETKAGLTAGTTPWAFSGVRGRIHLLAGMLRLDLTGSTIPGTVAGSVLRMDAACPGVFDGEFSVIPHSGIAPRYAVKIESPKPCSLLLLEREFPCEGFTGKLEAGGGRMAITGNGLVYGGRMGVSLDFPAAGQPGHTGSVVLNRAAFAPLTKLLGSTTFTEGFLSGNFTYSMEGASVDSLRGSGKAKLQGADIFALPLLGPLSPLVDALIPGEKLINSVAREATLDFRVADGKVGTENLEAATVAFRLTASGSVDYSRDAVDMIARVNLRGAPGMLLYPVSKLFEYEAKGVMREPGWKPRYLGNPFSRGEAAAPTGSAPRR